MTTKTGFFKDEADIQNYVDYIIEHNLFPPGELNYWSGKTKHAPSGIDNKYWASAVERLGIKVRE